MGYLERQNGDKSENLCDVNGFKILNIEKIISATAKIIFRCRRLVMTLSQENPQSQEFLKSTITWISVIFSKLVDLILISLDRIHY